MQNTINRLLTVIAITAFGMISAPTLSTINVVFADNQFSFGPFKALGIDKFFEKSANNNNNQQTSDNNQPKSDNNQPKSDNNQPKSGNSHAGEKCGANGGNTKNWYCKGTHHHCAKGQNDCLLEGGRTK